jgi:pSer/pThr/pTyr-binding forkhead associated (FHA) protein
MIKCRECSAYEPAGALYCSECGALLLDTEEELAGTRSPFTDALAPPSAPALVGQEAEPTTEAQKITFVIPSSGRQIQLELEPALRIGRADPSAEHFPELDLTPDEGSAYGVSRFHALIQLSREGYMLIDRNSTNGTMLNGYRLPPDLPYPIHSGDEIRFGQLLVHVFLE